MSREKQIEEMEKLQDRLIKRSFTEYNTVTSMYLVEAAKAIGTLLEGYRKQSEPISCGHEKGGEWVQLPCKVGDILYVISQMKDKRILPFINEYEVTSISIKKKSIVIYHEMDGYIKTFKHTDFGKTIFLSKAEAEKVLAKMKGGAE